MINIIYRLVSPKLFEEVYSEIEINNKVIVRPSHLSICKADQRYYQGKRDPEVIASKLPMALIHEGIGTVIMDNTNTFKVGDKVVMIPNTPCENDDIIKENYLKSSKFRASGFDGFMEDYVIMDSDRLVKIPNNINFNVAAFTELISVSVHSVYRFLNFSHKRKETIGVWGDGNLGYITSLVLKLLCPNSKIIVFGVNSEKLSLFTFVNETYKINEVPNDLFLDHAFECVGSQGAQLAIDQIINMINPQGTISLLGVCEYPVNINTRLILEKGLLVFGTSRSGKEDFIKTIELFEKYPEIVSYLEHIIRDIINIRSLNDINKAFETDANSNFGKTIMLWNK